MDYQIEHPVITKLCSFGVIDEEKVVAYCYYCGKEIYQHEDYYLLDAISVCSSYDCKEDAFLANADGMLIDFAKDYEVYEDAINWYLENYSQNSQYIW